MSPAEMLQKQKAFFASGGTRSYEARRAALRSLAAALDRHETALLEALQRDLGKVPIQGFTSELMVVHLEIAHALRHLKRWMKPDRRAAPMLALPGRAHVVREPCGAVLVIGPWNYPVQLMLTPLVGALAAGCTAVLKPSEFAPHSAEALAAMIADAFSLEQVALFQGGSERVEELQRESFDHVFFTGSETSGRKVLEAAAKTLTPVTLELGGKCPVLVFPGERAAEMERSLEVIARRIAWGKYLNAGQTCVAPDHVLVAQEWEAPLIEALARSFDSFGREEHGRLVHRRHFERVRTFLDDGRIVYGGEADEAALTIAPTILGDVKEGSAVMKEEIFGPILPVIPCANVDEALRRVRALPAPLAVYAFSPDRKLLDRIQRETISGGVCCNDTVVQITGPSLPFGGVGASGMGRYHGRAGYETFTRERAVLHRLLWPDLPFRYSPSRWSLGLMRGALRWLRRGR